MASKVNSAFIIFSAIISFGLISAHGRFQMEQNAYGSDGPDPTFGQSPAPAPAGDPVGFGSRSECSPGCVPGESIPTPSASMMSVSIPPPLQLQPMCGPGCLPECVPEWDAHLQVPVLLCYGSNPMGLRNFKWDHYHGRYASFRTADGMMNEAVNIASEPRPDISIDEAVNIASEPRLDLSIDEAVNIPSEPRPDLFIDDSQP